MSSEFFHYTILITNSRVYHLVLTGNCLSNRDIVCCFYPLIFSYSLFGKHFSFQYPTKGPPLWKSLLDPVLMEKTIPSLGCPANLSWNTFVVAVLELDITHLYFYIITYTLTRRLTSVYWINEWVNGWKNKEKKLYKVFYVCAQVSCDMTEGADNSWSSCFSPSIPGITGVCHHYKIVLEEHEWVSEWVSVHDMHVSVTEIKEKSQPATSTLSDTGPLLFGQSTHKLTSRDPPSLASLSP